LIEIALLGRSANEGYGEAIFAVFLL